MDLLKIKDPSFLKEMDIDELQHLAQDIRQFLIENCSKTGGHIGPNLGVVELTIALHKVFNSPEDKFLWDVGHQSYVHKILTGRADKFDTLRKFKGLCGFPKKCESEHDAWEAGHSSTSISGAAGIAAARDINGDQYHVVPIIGDGSMTGGMAFEALNHIGHEKSRVIVILNDNGMSIAPNVGAMHSMLGRIRASRKYNHLKDDIDTAINKVPMVGEAIVKTSHKVRGSFKNLVVPGMFFEELGFTYIGMVDGHNVEQVIANLEYAKKIDGPVLVHVITTKGKGFEHAESDKTGKWHGIGPYKLDTGEVIAGKTIAPSWSAVMSDTVTKLARKDERIVAITPAMAVGSKLEGFASEFPKRFFDVGIAEEHAATFAAGMALTGTKPYLSIYSSFLQRAYDQVLHDIARQKLNVVIGIDRAGLVGDDGETHQGVFDIAFLRHIPNMTIAMPKDENEGQNLMNSAFNYGGTVAVRYPRGNGLGVKMDEELSVIPYGTWEVLREGSDLCILTFGTTIPMALVAAEELAEQGISVKVVNARFIKPLDFAMLEEIFASKMPILTVEEAVLQGGFGSAVLEYAEEIGHRDTQISRMGIPDIFVEHGSVDLLMNELGLTKDGIVSKILEIKK